MTRGKQKNIWGMLTNSKEATMRKRILVSLVVILLSVMLTVLPLAGGCDQQAQTEEVLKVGCIMPLSGDMAVYGLPTLRTLQMWAEEINSGGGLEVAGKTYTIEIISADDLFTPEGSAAAANKLVYQDKVNFMIGGVDTHEVLAIDPITEKEKVLYFHNAYAKDVIDPDMPYSFRICASPHELQPAIYTWVAQNYPDAKKVYMIYPNAESGWAMRDFLTSLLPLVGLELVGTSQCEYTTVDFTPFLLQALEENPDIIDTGGLSPSQQAAICETARDMGYTGLFLDVCPLADTDLVDVAGKEAVEGFIGYTLPSIGPLATPEAIAFREAYIEEYGQWGASVIDIAIGFPILLDAIKAADSIEPDEVLAVLDSGKSFDTLVGPVRFGLGEYYGIAHQLLHPIAVTVITDGVGIPQGVVTADELLDWLEEHNY
jgi:branched-chain amino acid transport system substrate-binding protein